MHTTTTFMRRLLLPALLLAGFALTSCEHHKDCDPKPRNSAKCPNQTPPPAAPNGNS